MLANALNIRADIHINTKNNGAAEQDLAEALEVRKRSAIFSTLFPTRPSYQFLRHNRPDKGYPERSGRIVHCIQTEPGKPKLPFLYRALAENYKRMGDHQNYAATLETIMTLKDSQYKKNSAESLAELQAKYDLRKRTSSSAAVRPAPKIIYSTRRCCFSICFHWRDGSCSGATNEREIKTETTPGRR